MPFELCETHLDQNMEVHAGMHAPSHDGEQVSPDAYTALESLLESAQEIALCAHTNPDGDAVGSVLALACALRARWPEKSVCCLLADNKQLPASFTFLPGADAYVMPRDYTATPDVFVCLDLSEPHRLNEAYPIFARARKVVVLDHHPCEQAFGDVYIIKPEEAATSVVVFDVVKHASFALTADIAQCLLCGIMTDTGRFQYQNTNQKSLYAAGDMVAAGAQPAQIALQLFQSRSLADIALEARCMQRLQTAAAGRVCYSYVTCSDMEETGATDDEAGNLIDALRCLEGVCVALMVRELAGGKVRVNLRAKDNTDVSQIARMFGGGGHASAAGFTSSGSCEEVICDVICRLQTILPHPCESCA